MAGITQPKPGEHVNANGVWDLPRNKRKMTVFSLCLLLCADLLDLAVGKSDPPPLLPSPLLLLFLFFLLLPLRTVTTATRLKNLSVSHPSDASGYEREEEVAVLLLLRWGGLGAQTAR